MNFLPQDYQAPKAASQYYFKLQEGENRVRILSKPVFGWEDWTLERKPVRFLMNEKPAKSIDPKKPIKHFWAFVVWNVNEEQIQIMQITQATIRNSIEALCKDEDWGSPFGYDIKIIKKGEGKETEYSVNPAPHKEVSKEVLQAFKERPINLEALFISADPFSQEWNSYTKLMPDAKDEDNKITPISKPDMGDHAKPYITDLQFIELSELLQGCSDTTQSGFAKFLNDAHKIDSLNKLEAKDYNKIKEMLQVRYKENQKEALEKEMAKK